MKALKFGVGLLKEYLKDEFNVDRVDAAYINVAEKRFVKLTNDELRRLVK